MARSLGITHPTYGMAGIRIYFGNHDKTLIRRQREDDPKSMVGLICPSSTQKILPTSANLGVANYTSVGVTNY